MLGKCRPWISILSMHGSISIKVMWILSWRHVATNPKAPCAAVTVLQKHIKILYTIILSSSYYQIFHVPSNPQKPHNNTIKHLQKLRRKKKIYYYYYYFGWEKYDIISSFQHGTDKQAVWVADKRGSST